MRARRAADRLASGSAYLAARFGCWLLPGTLKTAAARIAGSGTTLAGGLAVAHHTPALMWPAAGAWCVAAWRNGRVPAAVDAAAGPEHDDHRGALLAWLDEATTGRNGIHLTELYGRLRERPALADLTDAQLRAVLAHYGVPVVRSLSVDGVSGRTGVRRADVEQLLGAPAPLSSDAASRPVESGVDQQVSRPLSATSRPVESGLDAHFSDAVTIVRGEGAA